MADQSPVGESFALESFALACDNFLYGFQGRAQRVARLAARNHAHYTAEEQAHIAESGRDGPMGTRRTTDGRSPYRGGARRRPAEARTRAAPTGRRNSPRVRE
jgi:hypothetical protein